MSTLKTFILIIFLSSSFAKIEYIDFLINKTCTNRVNEKGVCKFYKDCPHLIQKLNAQEITIEDIVECNEQNIICCTPDTLVTSTTYKNLINSDTSYAYDLKSGRISEQSK